jgi:K+-sensing histidine kinase KdpD
LGLWLCWSIVVERHGGRIWAEPVAEGGIRFVIDLPRLELDQDQDRPREKSG